MSSFQLFRFPVILLQCFIFLKYCSPVQAQTSNSRILNLQYTKCRNSNDVFTTAISPFYLYLAYDAPTDLSKEGLSTLVDTMSSFLEESLKSKYGNDLNSFCLNAREERRQRSRYFLRRTQEQEQQTSSNSNAGLKLRMSGTVAFESLFPPRPVTITDAIIETINGINKGENEELHQIISNQADAELEHIGIIYAVDQLQKSTPPIINSFSHSVSISSSPSSTPTNSNLPFVNPNDDLNVAESHSVQTQEGRSNFLVIAIIAAGAGVGLVLALLLAVLIPRRRRRSPILEEGKSKGKSFSSLDDEDISVSQTLESRGIESCNSPPRYNFYQQQQHSPHLDVINIKYPHGTQGNKSPLTPSSPLSEPSPLRTGTPTTPRRPSSSAFVQFTPERATPETISSPSDIERSFGRAFSEEILMLPQMLNTKDDVKEEDSRKELLPSPKLLSQPQTPTRHHEQTQITNTMETKKTESSSAPGDCMPQEEFQADWGEKIPYDWEPEVRTEVKMVTPTRVMDREKMTFDWIDPSTIPSVRRMCVPSNENDWTANGDNITYISSPGASKSTNFKDGEESVQLETMNASKHEMEHLSQLNSSTDMIDGSFPRFEMDDDEPYHLKTECSDKDATKSVTSFSIGGKSGIHSLDWSNIDASTVGGSTVNTDTDMSDLQGKAIWDQYLIDERRKKLRELNSQRAANIGLIQTNKGSGASFTSGFSSTSSDIFSCRTHEKSVDSTSTSRDLMNNILWLEKKICDRQSDSSNLGSHHSDTDRYSDTPVTQSIMCRDCYASPGPLQITIHSTKDGPAIHSVSESSPLQGNLFSGDLIIAVDNMDTRSMSAEQVMEVLQAKISSTRKLTVLHFGDNNVKSK